MAWIVRDEGEKKKRKKYKTEVKQNVISNQHQLNPDIYNNNNREIEVDHP